MTLCYVFRDNLQTRNHILHRPSLFSEIDCHRIDQDNMVKTIFGNLQTKYGYINLLHAG